MRGGGLTTIRQIADSCMVMFCTERSVVDCSVSVCLRLGSFRCFYVFIVCMVLCTAHCAYSINNNNNTFSSKT